MRVDVMTHEFVESAPDTLADGKVYVSIPFATVLHKCCCGCGTEVVTPLSPAEWRITFDGESISLHPSIGNWGLQCGSHYVIERNRVRWADRWSTEQIEKGRAADRRARQIHVGEKKTVAADAAKEPAEETRLTAPTRSISVWLRRLWGRFFG